MDMKPMIIGAEGTIWKHKKTGHQYVIIGACRIESTNTLSYLYKGGDGIVWARPVDEFMDGRFESMMESPWTEAK